MKYPAGYEGQLWCQQLYDWILVDNHPLKPILSDKLAMRDWIKTHLQDQLAMPEVYCVAETLVDLYNCITTSPHHPRFAWVKANLGSGSSAPLKCEGSRVTVLRRNHEIHLVSDHSLITPKRIILREHPLFNFFREIPFKIFTERSLGFNMTAYNFMCSHGKVGIFYSFRPKRGASFSTSSDIICTDRELNPINWLLDYPQNQVKLDSSVPYETMVRLAEQIAQHHPFMRVDFYWAENRIWLGEIGFNPGMYRPNLRRVDDTISFKLLPIPDLSLATT